MEHPTNLHQKYPDLHRSEEVLNIAHRARAKRGEDPDADIDLSQNPEGRIQNYLDYLSESVGENNPERDEKLSHFKQKLYEKYCITDASQIPESYWVSVQENHRRELRPVPEMTADLKRELAEPIIGDQKDSLDQWIDYLASPDAKYPDWLKYWTIRNVLKMGRYDKEKQKFAERYGGSVSPFPELNREALALVVDAMVKKYSKEQPDFGYDISEEIKQKFLSELNKENFAKLYAIAIEEFKPISENLLKITDGEWKQYKKGSNPQTLVDSLKHHGTGWCIRGLSTAQRYLQDFDLEVYYSNNEQSEPIVPRLVIVRFPDGRVSEFRGVAKKEEHDQYISPVVSQKIVSLGSAGEQFRKSKSDIDELDAVYEKMKRKQQLTRAELVFLYELDAQIEGFGYGRPERVKELRQARKDAGLLEADMLAIFDCTKDQIAYTQTEVKKMVKDKKEVKAYIGPLFKNIFKEIGHLEHLYTSFPEKKIKRDKVTIDGTPANEMESKINKKGFKVWPHAKTMMKKISPREGSEEIDLIRLTVGDLGFTKSATLKEICDKAKEYGLDVCPPEVGPHYRVGYDNQPMNEYLTVAMETFSDSGDRPNVFFLNRCSGGVWLTTAGRIRSALGIPRAGSSFVSASSSLKFGIFDKLDTLTLGYLDTLFFLANY